MGQSGKSVKSGAHDRKRERVIAALIECPTLAEAAKEASVSRSSIYRWLGEEEFAKRFREAKRATVSMAIGRIGASMHSAIAALNEVCSNKGADDKDRVAAAKTILEFGFRGVEFEDVEARVAELERKLES